MVREWRREGPGAKLQSMGVAHMISVSLHGTLAMASYTSPPRLFPINWLVGQVRVSIHKWSGPQARPTTHVSAGPARSSRYSQTKSSGDGGHTISHNPLTTFLVFEKYCKNIAEKSTEKYCGHFKTKDKKSSERLLWVRCRRRLHVTLGLGAVFFIF